MDETISSNGIIITKSDFQLGNRRVFIKSAEVHYFRIPPDEWEDRLTKVRALGFNTISTYVYWNFHEGEAGNFDIISKEKDLDHFLHLCENKGFYIIIRPGPWIGADLPNGGIPQWVFDEHPKIMSLDQNYVPTKWKTPQSPPISYLSPTYLRIVDKYFTNLSDVFRRHLYPHGGLILLQIDNELSFGSHGDLFNVDYNPVAIEFYKKSLKEKYQDIETVNQLYNQNFVSFEHIDPPTLKTLEDAFNSQNEFKNRGEFLRLLDWMEIKERILQEFVGSISYFLRKKGIFLPYFVTISSVESPIHPQKLYYAYKTRILTGLSMQEKFLPPNEIVEDILDSNIEILRSQMPLLIFFPEVKIGAPDTLISPNKIHLTLRLAFSKDIKGINIYMGAGGISPILPTEKSISVLEDEKKSQFADIEGVTYDFGAPISREGKKNPSYDIVELFLKYIQANEKSIISSEKVYDEELVILSYHPYTRMKFDSSKLGSISAYNEILQTNPHPEYSLVRHMGLHPMCLDLENLTLEQLRKYKVALIVFSSFLDSKSMQLLREFIEEGGKLISFLDIPTRNEHMVLDDLLSGIYNAKILKRDNERFLFIQGKKIVPNGQLLSFSLSESESNSNTNRQNTIIASDNVSNPNKIFGFHRSVGKGEIFHFGFLPVNDQENIGVFENYLSSVKSSLKKSDYPKDLILSRLRSKNHEEFVTVVNTTRNKLENAEFVFREVKDPFGEEGIQLKELTILPETALQWSINKKITEYLYIKICTSEINEMRRQSNTDAVHYSVSGFHFKGSRNVLEINLQQKPIKVISGKKDITKKVFKSDNKLRIQFKEMQIKDKAFFKLNVIYSDDLQLSLHFEGKEKKEIVDFNINKTNTFND